MADFSELEVCERVSDKDVLFKMKTRRGDHYPTLRKTPLRLLLQIGGHLIIKHASADVVVAGVVGCDADHLLLLLLPHYHSSPPLPAVVMCAAAEN